MLDPQELGQLSFDLYRDSAFAPVRVRSNLAYIVASLVGVAEDEDDVT